MPSRRQFLEKLAAQERGNGLADAAFGQREGDPKDVPTGYLRP